MAAGAESTGDAPALRVRDLRALFEGQEESKAPASKNTEDLGKSAASTRQTDDSASKLVAPGGHEDCAKKPVDDAPETFHHGTAVSTQEESPGSITTVDLPGPAGVAGVPSTLPPQLSSPPDVGDKAQAVRRSVQYDVASKKKAPMPPRSVRRPDSEPTATTSLPSQELSELTTDPDGQSTADHLLGGTSVLAPPIEPPVDEPPTSVPSTRRPPPVPERSKVSQSKAVRGLAGAESNGGGEGTPAITGGKASQAEPAAADRPPLPPRPLAPSMATVSAPGDQVGVPRSGEILFRERRAPPRPAARGATAQRYRDCFAEVSTEVDGERLVRGSVVHNVWSRSRLPESVLSSIWTAVAGDDTTLSGLTESQFTQGLYMIDAQLRRAQLGATPQVVGAPPFVPQRAMAPAP